MTRKIILDTDPGGDDIFALFWLQSLIKQGMAELVAVTTAGGNVSDRSTFTAASKILNLGSLNQISLGRGVPVKTTEIEDAAAIHGSDGMGNLSQTLPDGLHLFEAARYSDEVIIEKLNQFPGEITLVAIAPLTNLAAAEAKSPGILKKAQEIVIMAGAFNHRGNITSQAEFNVAYHPEAAAKVLVSRDDIVMVTLDVTRQLILTNAMVETITQKNPKSPISQFMRGLCQFMTTACLRYRETGGIEGFLVHDAATIAYLFYPETLHFQRAKVEIETQSSLTRGQTILDRRHLPKTSVNTWVSSQVDAVNFLAILMADLKLIC
jgi:inosine-uridine nucleoside N-ribohydrolase